MPDTRKKQIVVKESIDIVKARGACREMARELGFGSADQTRLATAVSEIVRNTYQYAGDGMCIIVDESTSGVRRIKIVVEDSGPGFEDIDKSLKDGYTTSGGMGAGLPGARRLVDEFEVKSRPGRTVVTMVMTRNKM